MVLRTLVLTLILGVALSTTNAQEAQVQILHNCADPAAASVDVWVNGTRALDDFAFRTATPFIPLPAGVDLNVAITGPDADNADAPVFSTTLNLMADARYVVVASGVINPDDFAANDDPNAAPLGFTLIPVGDIRTEATDMNSVDLFAFHGATDAPAVDVRAGGNNLIEGLSYGAASAYLSVPAASYVLGVAPAGGNVIAEFTADVSGLGGNAIIVVASGFLNPAANQDGAAFGLFAVAAAGGEFIELPVVAEEATASVQILHNCADPGAATVDVWVNGERALDDFAFRTATPFIPLPAGVDLTVAITGPDAENADNPVYSATLNLMADARYVVIASGVIDPNNYAPNSDPNAASLNFMLIPVTPIRAEATDMNSVDFFAFHGATDAPAVDVRAGQTNLFESLSYGSASDYASVPAAEYTINIAPAGGNPIAAYAADLSALGGNALTVVASGFLTPASNQNGPAFGLYAISAAGGAFIELPSVPVQEFAQVQVIHNAADPAAAEVDVYLGETKIADNFAFRTASAFLNVPANTDLVIGVAGPDSESSNDAIATFPVNLETGRYIVVANGVLSEDGFAANPDMRAPAITFNLYPVGSIRQNSVNPGEVDFIAFHGATDAPAVDITANGSVPLAADLVYGSATDYLSVPAASYTINVAPAGGEPIANFTADLTNLAGNALFVVASGFLTPEANSNGAAFGLWAATAAGGALVELPAVTTSVDEEFGTASTATVAPNPAFDEAMVSFDLPVSADVTLTITNATGNVVRSVYVGNLSAGMQRSSLRVDDLASGMYYVTVAGGRYTNVTPLIVTH